MKRQIAVALASAAFTLAVSAPAFADVLWNWSFSSESGTFTTDGTFADAAGAHTFGFTGFHVTTSVVSSNVGATYLVVQPDQGFIWNGSTATEFFRDSGILTNGSNFNNAVTNYRYTLFPGTSFLVDASEHDVTTGDLTITPVGDVSAAEVPTLGKGELALLALLVAGAGAFVLSRRGV